MSRSEGAHSKPHSASNSPQQNRFLETRMYSNDYEHEEELGKGADAWPKPGIAYRLHRGEHAVPALDFEPAQRSNYRGEKGHSKNLSRTDSVRSDFTDENSTIGEFIDSVNDRPISEGSSPEQYSVIMESRFDEPAKYHHIGHTRSPSRDSPLHSVSNFDVPQYQTTESSPSSSPRSHAGSVSSSHSSSRTGTSSKNSRGTHGTHGSRSGKRKSKVLPQAELIHPEGLPIIDNDPSHYHERIVEIAPNREEDMEPSNGRAHRNRSHSTPGYDSSKNNYLPDSLPQTFVESDQYRSPGFGPITNTQPTYYSTMPGPSQVDPPPFAATHYHIIRGVDVSPARRLEPRSGSHQMYPARSRDYRDPNLEPHGIESPTRMLDPTLAQYNSGRSYSDHQHPYQPSVILDRLRTPPRTPPVNRLKERHSPRSPERTEDTPIVYFPATDPHEDDRRFVKLSHDTSPRHDCAFRSPGHPACKPGCMFSSKSESSAIHEYRGSHSQEGNSGVSPRGNIATKRPQVNHRHANSYDREESPGNSARMSGIDPSKPKLPLSSNGLIATSHTSYHSSSSSHSSCDSGDIDALSNGITVPRVTEPRRRFDSEPPPLISGPSAPTPPQAQANGSSTHISYPDEIQPKSKKPRALWALMSDFNMRESPVAEEIPDIWETESIDQRSLHPIFKIGVASFVGFVMVIYFVIVQLFSFGSAPPGKWYSHWAKESMLPLIMDTLGDPKFAATFGSAIQLDVAIKVQLEVGNTDLSVLRFVLIDVCIIFAGIFLICSDMELGEYKPGILRTFPVVWLPGIIWMGLQFVFCFTFGRTAIIRLVVLVALILFWFYYIKTDTVCPTVSEQFLGRWKISIFILIAIYSILYVIFSPGQQFPTLQVLAALVIFLFDTTNRMEKVLKHNPIKNFLHMMGVFLLFSTALVRSFHRSATDGTAKIDVQFSYIVLMQLFIQTICFALVARILDGQYNNYLLQWILQMDVQKSKSSRMFHIKTCKCFNHNEYGSDKSIGSHSNEERAHLSQCHKYLEAKLAIMTMEPERYQRRFDDYWENLKSDFEKTVFVVYRLFPHYYFNCITLWTEIQLLLIVLMI